VTQPSCFGERSSSRPCATTAPLIHPNYRFSSKTISWMLPLFIRKILLPSTQATRSPKALMGAPKIGLFRGSSVGRLLSCGLARFALSVLG
jgi:hypothetical protein